jgi:5-methylcytosine-specific restriction endonuclease McrA
MKPYVKMYMEHFNYALDDFIGCEVCGARAVDIHHIYRRGMGGTKKSDQIENLIALCRDCHSNLGDKKQHLEFLEKKHQSTLKYVENR